jgi:regulatory protein
MPSRSRAKNPLDCHERALRLLAVRPRSRNELGMRLSQAGFEPEEVAGELERLEAVGLVDDEDFARQLVEHELGNRNAGTRGVIQRLVAKGVDRGTIDRTLAEVAAPPEEERALELATGRARRLSSLPRETAYGRLLSFLQRRGYGYEVASRAAAGALALDPEAEGSRAPLPQHPRRRTLGS